MWIRVEGHSAVSLKVEGIHLRHYDLSQKKQAQELKIKTTSKNKQLSSIFFPGFEGSEEGNTLGRKGSRVRGIKARHEERPG